MSAAALYRSMGLKGFEVEDTWEGKNGALFVSVSVPRETLRCRRVHFQVDLGESRAERFQHAGQDGAATCAADAAAGLVGSPIAAVPRSPCGPR